MATVATEFACIHTSRHATALFNTHKTLGPRLRGDDTARGAP